MFFSGVPGLMIVATKKIHAGQEIVLSYGKAFWDTVTTALLADHYRYQVRTARYCHSLYRALRKLNFVAPRVRPFHRRAHPLFDSRVLYPHWISQSTASMTFDKLSLFEIGKRQGQLIDNKVIEQAAERITKKDRELTEKRMQDKAEQIKLKKEEERKQTEKLRNKKRGRRNGSRRNQPIKPQHPIIPSSPSLSASPSSLCSSPFTYHPPLSPGPILSRSVVDFSVSSTISQSLLSLSSNSNYQTADFNEAMCDQDDEEYFEEEKSIHEERSEQSNSQNFNSFIQSQPEHEFIDLT